MTTKMFISYLTKTSNLPKKVLQWVWRIFIVALFIANGTGILPGFVLQKAFAESDYSYPMDYSDSRMDYWNTYNSPPINNYVTATPNVMPTFTAAATSQSPGDYYDYYGHQDVFATDGVYSPQPERGGYLAMNSWPVFRRNNAQTLVPQFPSYDHWSEVSEQPWTMQLLPKGLIFPSYMAGMKEPRLATMWVHDENFNWVWDATLGGRAGLLRFGTPNSVLPEGIQIDMEGAVQLRMDMEHGRNMMSNDFRAGMPITFGGRNWQFKTGYYHVSSHMGDHHLLRTGEMRINYVRDALVLAVAKRFWDDFRVYGETAWAFYTGVETKPWEFQFGLEYSPIFPAMGFHGTPFVAVNMHLFQELNFSGYLCCQLGWQWRGSCNQMVRIGLQYLNGYDDQFQFHRLTTQKLGLGIWYDF